MWVDRDGNAATPLFHGYMHKKTDVFQTQGTIDTGNVVKDYALASVYSVENALRTTVNSASLVLNTGTFTYAKVTGSSFERAEDELFAAFAGAPFLGGGYTVLTGRPFRAFKPFARANKSSNTKQFNLIDDEVPVAKSTKLNVESSAGGGSSKSRNMTDPPGTERTPNGSLIDSNTKRFVKDPNKAVVSEQGVTANDLRKTVTFRQNRKDVVGGDKVCELCQDAPATQADHIEPADLIAKEGNKRGATLDELDKIANAPDNLAGTCGGKGGCNPSKSNKILSEEPGPGKFVAKDPTPRMKAKAEEFKARGL